MKILLEVIKCGTRTNIIVFGLQHLDLHICSSSVYREAVVQSTKCECQWGDIMRSSRYEASSFTQTVSMQTDG